MFDYSCLNVYGQFHLHGHFIHSSDNHNLPSNCVLTVTVLIIVVKDIVLYRKECASLLLISVRKSFVIKSVHFSYFVKTSENPFL